MLHEWTNSAASRAFKRTARLAMVVVALAGLTACGGGGGGGSSTPKTPEMTIVPTQVGFPEGFSGTVAGAQTITDGETVDGTLESADAVKYYRLDVAERTTIDFTLDAEEGIEITVLDEHGNVISSAETASEVTRRVTAPAGRLYVRIRDKLKRGWDSLNRDRRVKSFRLGAKIVGIAENLYNIVHGIPRLNLTIAGKGVIIDLRDYVRVRDGRTVNWTVTVSIPGIQATVEGTKVRFTPTGEAVRGLFSWRLEATDPVLGVVGFSLFEGSFGAEPPTPPEGETPTTPPAAPPEGGTPMTPPATGGGTPAAPPAAPPTQPMTPPATGGGTPTTGGEDPGRKTGADNHCITARLGRDGSSCSDGEQRPVADVTNTCPFAVSLRVGIDPSHEGATFVHFESHDIAPGATQRVDTTCSTSSFRPRFMFCAEDVRTWARNYFCHGDNPEWK